MLGKSIIDSYAELDITYIGINNPSPSHQIRLNIFWTVVSMYQSYLETPSVYWPLLEAFGLWNFSSW